MHPTEPCAVAIPTTAPEPTDYWRALLHRWFVEYNPFYLVSAMLVLAGLNLVSRGLAGQGSLYGPLAVATLAELYAGSLVAGAALLMRNGQRRSAVVLALLAIAYQGDLTLHTETCAVLGAAGIVATTTWLVLFALKLILLARAMRVRIAPRALATALLGGAGLALAPYLLPQVSAAGGSSFKGVALAMFVAGLFALAPRRLEETIVAREELGAWGQLVLQRAVRVTWLAWALLLAVHVLFWTNQGPIDIVPTLAALLFMVAARRVRESRLWLALALPITGVTVVTPARFSSLAMLAAFALLVRALTHRTTSTRLAAAAPTPYRTLDAAAVDPDVGKTVATSILEIAATERLRLLTGALMLGYLAVFMRGWPGGTLPAHHVLLDASLVVVSLLMAWRLGARLALACATTIVGHGLAMTGLVPVPHSHLEWGMIALGTGFVLLFGSLAISHRTRLGDPSRPLRPSRPLQVARQ